MKTAKLRSEKKSKTAKAKTPKVPKAKRMSKPKPGGAKLKAPKLAKHKTGSAEKRMNVEKKPPVAINSRKREPGGDSERGFYLRLGDPTQGPKNKAKVHAAAKTFGISMNEFAATATMKFVEAGLNPANCGPVSAEAMPETAVPASA